MKVVKLFKSQDTVCFSEFRERDRDRQTERDRDRDRETERVSK